MITQKMIDKNLDRKYIQNLLVNLIRIPSVNPPEKEGEKKAALFLIEKMKELGLETIYDEIVPGRANATGILKGKKEGPTLILNGHLDVVPANADLWDNKPFEPVVKERKMYGRGTADMKGALAAMLGAVKLIRDNYFEYKGKVIVSFVCDEERSNLGVTNFLKNNIKADFAIIGEPTNLEIARAIRGIAVFKITTIGKAGHSSKPKDSVNAIYKMSKILERLQTYCNDLENRHHEILPPPTIAVSIIRGGNKENIIPDKCEIIVDRRLIPGETGDTALSELTDMLNEIKCKDKNFDFFIERLEKPFTLPGELTLSNSFVKKVANIYRSYFNVEKPPIVGFQASCEQTFFLNMGIDALIFGPGSIAQAHVADEYVELEQLFKAAGFYASCILNLN
jgi:acetylornithine deacetylase/succinyl-diaminopimelate desuccinylase family protein